MCRRSVGLDAPYIQLQFFPWILSSFEHQGAHQCSQRTKSSFFQEIPGEFPGIKADFPVKDIMATSCPFAWVTLLGACSAVNLKVLIILIMNKGVREVLSAVLPASLLCLTGAWKNSVCLCQPCAQRQQQDQT